MTENLHISTPGELNFQYNWFCNTFAETIQAAANDFFSDIFSLKLVSLSSNINVLLQGDEYFVTKIRLDKQHDVFFRGSSLAVKIILDGCLGEVKNYNISTITELEAKIISSFNDFLYGHIAQFLPEKIDKKEKRKNFDTINLTFLIKIKDSDKCGKFIVSLPQVLLFPQSMELDASYDVSNFNQSEIFAKIKVGTTKFHLKEIQLLEKDDIVVFEDSNMNKMTIEYKDYISDFNITPNPEIVTSIGDDNGGDTMSDENSISPNLWDTIQVDMGAEFDSVKISLGDLKNIQSGMVVDLVSIYDNKVSLIVENNIIARGELVIINDRYGVKIDEVYAARPDAPQVMPAQIPQNANAVPQNIPQAQAAPAPQPQQQPQPQQPQPQQEADGAQQGGDGEFDYSDFDLDDQDL